MKTTKIRQSARGEYCQVRIPAHCNGNTETTVLAHLNGGGMGMKHQDIFAAYCCSACHDLYDGRTKSANYSRDQINMMFYQGVIRTQAKLIEKGLLIIKGV